MYTQTVLKENLASVSVGICATVELDNTMQLTDLILGLDQAKMRLLEVIVATPNRRLAGELAERDPRLVVEIERKREGKASALNKILKRASGDILVLASADIKLTRNTIPRLVQALITHPEWGLVDSRVELVNGDKLLMDRVSTFLWEIHNATLDELNETGRLGHVAGDLFAVRRDLMDTLPDVINDDAYLALKVEGYGFRVKRVQDALVWIMGPRTPSDYVYQRTRVLQGHLQLIRWLGRVPTTFEFQVLSRPRRYLRVYVKTVARLGPSHLLPMFVAGFLEFLSFHIAVVSSIIHHDYKSWRIAETTKRI